MTLIATYFNSLSPGSYILRHRSASDTKLNFRCKCTVVVVVVTKVVMGYEGGFCGMTNKLVDGCYSFWQEDGAVAVLEVG